MTNNIDIFNKFCGDLLARLYETFPVEKDLKITDFEYLDNEELSDIFFSSIKFLKREGFINFSMAFYGGYTSVCLTAKALALLNSVPKSLETNETLGSQLSNVVKEGKSEVIKKVVSEIIRASTDVFS